MTSRGKICCVADAEFGWLVALKAVKPDWLMGRTQTNDLANFLASRMWGQEKGNLNFTEARGLNAVQGEKRVLEFSLLVEHVSWLSPGFNF